MIPDLAIGQPVRLGELKFISQSLSYFNQRTVKKICGGVQARILKGGIKMTLLCCDESMVFWKNGGGAEGIIEGGGAE